MRLGIFEVTHSITCKCHREVSAGTQGGLWAKFFLHCWARHEVSTRELLTGLWALARGKRP